MLHIITNAQFEDLLKAGLGEHYERALAVFTNYGSILSWDVVNVLLHAIDKKKIEDVFTELEKHWEEHLQYQHPKIRGTVEDKMLGINKTQMIFIHVCKDILQLQPA